MLTYTELLAQEENFRVNEQNVLLSALLSNPSRGTLSILRRAGLAMTGMEICGRTSGPGGRIIIELESAIKANLTADAAQQNCFKAGELVKIIVNGQLLKCTGTIERKRVNETSTAHNKCSISLSSSVETEELEMLSNGTGRLALIKIVDEVGEFVKMKRNLEIVNERVNEDGLIGEMAQFIKLIETNKLTSPKKTNLESAQTSTSSNKLNHEQEMAMMAAIKMVKDPLNNLLLIHGPPGTGKTSTLVEIIKRLRQEHLLRRILICGPSNLSVDNIVERLLAEIEGIGSEGKLLRVGHPSRVLESCQGSTLDFWSEHSDAGRLLKDVQREIDEIVKSQLPKCKSREERRSLYGELKLLRQERKRREKSLHFDLLRRAEIVVCTLSTACGKKIFQKDSELKFDLAILDEAGQSLLPETLIAPILAKKLIMAGDHCQLPPTVMNPETKNRLEISLFEYLIKSHKTSDSIMLKEQYRMNELIMKWSNSVFYSGNLRAHESVRNWKLCELKGDEQDVLIFYDTCGFDLWESEESKSEGKSSDKKTVLIEEMSKFNEGEAKIVLDHYKKLIDSGIKSENIAIISPYSAQVSLFRELMSSNNIKSAGNGVEINSIDAFQGREKDAVIISMVRSNPDGVVGFLAEMRRINVAMTRAKKQLVIIGDSDTLSRDAKLKGLVITIFQIVFVLPAGFLG